ncbi:MAG: thiamine-phosphate kinase [Pseudomonadota bacterium]
MPNEFEIITKFLSPLAGEGAFDFKDDAAILSLPPEKELVITQDALAGGVHFFEDDPPEMIAKKALRTNLSDLASKGARPYSISLALGLKADVSEDWLRRFAMGLGDDMKAFNVSLSGGDTFVIGAQTVISITALGLIDAENYLSRLNAKPGDGLFVTGTIGDGALGLLARQGKLGDLVNEQREYLIDRYLLPKPRVEIADLLHEFASAAMDISDGLAGDLEKLCAASGVGAQIELDNSHFSNAVQNAIEFDSDLLKTAVTGGDDYEILFAVPQDKISSMLEHAKELPFTVTCLGKTCKAREVIFQDHSGQKMTFDKTGFDHFRTG